MDNQIADTTHIAHLDCRSSPHFIVVHIPYPVKMLGKLTSAFSSLNPSRAPSPPPALHDSQVRAKQYANLAETLSEVNVPVSDADCAVCQNPCDLETAGSSAIIESGGPWDGKPYRDYIDDRYGDLGEWPDSIETDWESELAGSAQGGRGRVVVVSTAKSDWERDHYVNPWSSFPSGRTH